MPRKATGSIREKLASDGKTVLYYARFSAPDAPGGQSKRQELPLGRSPAMNPERAQVELDNILADVRRGKWVKPSKTSGAPVVAEDPDPTMHVLASDWVAKNKPDWNGGTKNDYLWQVQNHILPFWKDHRVSEVTVTEFDRFVSYLRGEDTRDRKQRVVKGYRKADGQPLARSSINSIIERMAQILDLAVRRSDGKLANVARLPGTKVKRDKNAKAQREFDALEVDELLELLDAGGTLDRIRRADQAGLGRRALIAVLCYAGLRVSEVCRLRWRDVDLAGGVIKVGVRSGDGKTAASLRIVNIVPALRDELATWKASSRFGTRGRDRVFPTAAGGARDKDNVRQRILNPTLDYIDERRADEDRDSFPHFKSHTGRRTFATNLIAIGEMPDYVQDQLGHEDPTLAMRVYRQRRSRRDKPDARLFELYGKPHHLAEPDSEPTSVPTTQVPER